MPSRTPCIYQNPVCLPEPRVSTRTTMSLPEPACVCQKNVCQAVYLAEPLCLYVYQNPVCLQESTYVCHVFLPEPHMSASEPREPIANPVSLS